MSDYWNRKYREVVDARLALVNGNRCFKRLGLSPFCNNVYEVKQAYRRLALLYHPDRTNNPATAVKFIQIHEAYQMCLEALDNHKSLLEVTTYLRISW